MQILFVFFQLDYCQILPIGAPQETDRQKQGEGACSFFLFVWFCGCHHPSHGCHAVGNSSLFYSLAVFSTPSVVPARSRQRPLPAAPPIYRVTLNMAKFEWGPEQGKALQQVQAAGQGVLPRADPQLQSLRSSVSLTARGVVSTGSNRRGTVQTSGVWEQTYVLHGQITVNCPHST